MRLVLALAALVLLTGVWSPRSEAQQEQSITVLTPPEEQRIEVLNSGQGGQNVQGVDSGAVQGVYENEIPSEAGRTANTVGKVALSVTAAAVSLGVMAASLLFL